MRKMTVAIGLAALLGVPAGAEAEPKPDQGNVRAAVAQCKSERGKTKATRRAFKAKYHSMSRCVRQKPAQEAAEREAAQKNAAKECKAERAASGAQAFAEKYGRNGNRRTAFGTCVSRKGREA